MNLVARTFGWGDSGPWLRKRYVSPCWSPFRLIWSDEEGVDKLRGAAQRCL